MSPSPAPSFALAVSLLGSVEPLPVLGAGLAGVIVLGVVPGTVAGVWLIVSVTGGFESSLLQPAMAAARSRTALAANCGARMLRRFVPSPH
jgi:hypothetical protein